MTGGTIASRYSPAAAAGGIGPMRHNPSAWIRSDSHPYDGVSMDPTGVNTAYGLPPTAYDRSRPYDVRPDPRHFYDERRDNGYGGAAYDPSRENPYGAPGYAATGSGQAEMFSMRDYRDMPVHARPDPMHYAHNR
jgi:hypothetical protein